MIKIAVDLMGADKNESLLLSGVIDAIKENKELFVYILGTEEVLSPILKEENVNPDQYEVINCSDVVNNTDNPMEVFRTKADSSMIKGISLCSKTEDIEAFVSCGSTGALMVSSMMILRPLCPTLTPVLLCELLKKNGEYICLSDCGANLDCPADKILSFAKMGSAYMKAKGVENPKVRLLSNGAEDSKGTTLIKETNKLLRESSLNFLGNIEGSTVLTTDADVIATDGYSGNVLLKTLESGTTTVIKEISDYAQTLEGEEKEKLEAFASSLTKKYDYNTQGGAVLLGVKKPVIKGHGSATGDTVLSIIRIAYTLAKNNIVDKIKEEFGI
ncbi:MAG: phosphate acyltransferase PlsX [Clostridia bacterium]|nr:phosphate acyltransferase PlsX [Clostridia bacterium]